MIHAKITGFLIENSKSLEMKKGGSMAVARILVETTPSYLSDKEDQRTSMKVSIAAFRDNYDHLISLSKGEKVIFSGELCKKKFSKDGVDMEFYNMTVEDFYPVKPAGPLPAKASEPANNELDDDDIPF